MKKAIYFVVVGIILLSLVGCGHQHTLVVDAAIPANCTETGLSEGSHCSECNKIIVKQETIEKTEHTKAVDEEVPASCTNTGLSEGAHCSVCDFVISKQSVIKALGHNIVSDPSVPPTCSAFGLTEGNHCSLCNKVMEEQKQIGKLDHTIVIDAAVPSTTTSTGLSEGSHCSVCGTVIVNQQNIPKLAQSYNLTAKGVKITLQDTKTGTVKYQPLCGNCNTYGAEETVHMKLSSEIEWRCEQVSGGHFCMKCGCITNYELLVNIS